MAYIPGRAQAPVLGPFCLAKNETTVGRYRECVTVGSCTAPDQIGPRPSNYDATDPNLPVNFVDFDQARAYCKFIGGRLPTVDEWKWAFSSAGSSRLPFGDATPADADVCCGGAAVVLSCPVGESRTDVSAHGIHDLLGNLQELVEGAASPVPGGGVIMMPVCPNPPSPPIHESPDSVGGYSTAGFRCAADPAG